MDRIGGNPWTRNNTNKTSSHGDRPDRDGHTTPSAQRFGSFSSGRNGTIGSSTPSGVTSPVSKGSSSAFGLGSGAFASFGSAAKGAKASGGTDAVKTPGSPNLVSDRTDDKEAPRRMLPLRSASSNRVNTQSSVADPQAHAKDGPWPLKNAWVIWYRPPMSKNSDYEKSTRAMCRMATVQHFWIIFKHLKRPSVLPTVSDYHFFKEGIRPVWEDAENEKGGKWVLKLKKGIADRYWEDLLLALVGDQFAEAGEVVCGAVISARNGEDVLSIWTKNDGGRNIKIRETIKRVLSLPADTNLEWRSHDSNISQKSGNEHGRSDKPQLSVDKLRNASSEDQEQSRLMPV